MGYTEYFPIAAKYRVPIVVTGFEPLDLLQGIYMCVLQLEQGRFEVENQYARAVRREGTCLLRSWSRRSFSVVDRKWRGIGGIRASGLGLADDYAEFDAETRFGVSEYTAQEDPECISGLIMQGAKKPEECSAYGDRCTSDHPLGAPMVSSEGACAAYYRYRRLRARTHVAATEGAVVAEVKEFQLQCPVPLNDCDHVQLAHGGGGRRMHELLEGLLLPSFGNDILLERHDGATLNIAGARLAFTTDSYVVRPLFFPGGDIGTLAINGTVNDLAMCGARPLYLSSALILEEGLPMETLRRVVESMRSSARLPECSLSPATPRSWTKAKATVSSSTLPESASSSIKFRFRQETFARATRSCSAATSDVMASRSWLRAKGLSFESAIESDCAPLWEPVEALLAAGIEIHCLRDLTRGGLSSGLIEIAEASGTRSAIEEVTIPVREEVTGACEILGLDPLYLANEGRFVAFVPAAGGGTRA